MIRYKVYVPSDQRVPRGVCAKLDFYCIKDSDNYYIHQFLIVKDGFLSDCIVYRDGSYSFEARVAPQGIGASYIYLGTVSIDIEITYDNFVDIYSDLIKEHFPEELV